MGIFVATKVARTFFSFLLIASFSTSCSFKGVNDAQTSVLSQSKIFTPGPISEKVGQEGYLLLGIIEVPEGEYKVSLFKVKRGSVFYPTLVPEYHQDISSNSGHRITYRNDRKGITSDLIFVPYLNNQKVTQNEFTVPKGAVLRFLAYGRYGAVTDLVSDLAQKPTEFVTEFMPTNNYGFLCPSNYYIKPTRSVNFDFCPGKDGLIPFVVQGFDSNDARKNLLPYYQRCGFIQNNDDLADYYSQFDKIYENDSSCSGKIGFRKWYFFESSIKFDEPRVEFTNISEFVTPMDETEALTSISAHVHKQSVWGY